MHRMRCLGLPLEIQRRRRNCTKAVPFHCVSGDDRFLSFHPTLPKRGDGYFFFATNPRGKSVCPALLQARRKHYTPSRRGKQEEMAEIPKLADYVTCVQYGDVPSNNTCGWADVQSNPVPDAACVQFLRKMSSSTVNGTVLPPSQLQYAAYIFILDGIYSKLGGKTPAFTNRTKCLHSKQTVPAPTNHAASRPYRTAARRDASPHHSGTQDACPYRYAGNPYASHFYKQGEIIIPNHLGENKGKFEIEGFHAQAGGRWIVRPLGSVTTSGNWHFAGRSRGMFL